MPATSWKHTLSLPIRLNIESLKELEQLLSTADSLSFEYTVESCMYECASLEQFLSETNDQQIRKLTQKHQLEIKAASLGITIRFGAFPSVTLTNPTNERIGIYTRVINLLSKNSYSWLTPLRSLVLSVFLLGIITGIITGTFFAFRDIWFLRPDLPTITAFFPLSIIVIPLLVLILLIRVSSISVLVSEKQPATFWDKINIENIISAIIGSAIATAIQIVYNYFKN